MSSAMTVTVLTGYRAHLGFYRFNDPPYVYGSLGVSLTKPRLSVSYTLNEDSQGIIVKAQTEEAKDIIRRAATSINPELRGEIKAAGFIEHHVGLGTRTRLVLSTLKAVKVANSLNFNIDRKAYQLGVGRYSAVGLYTFLKGGFIADTGLHGGFNNPPQLLFRFETPPPWRILLVLPKGKRGMSEDSEKSVMVKPLKHAHQSELYSAFLLLIRSLVIKDFELFTSSLEKLQMLTGEYFSKYQDGIYCCELSEFIARYLKSKGLRGIGQSSWGPLIYGFMNSPSVAEAVANKVKKELKEVGVNAYVWVSEIPYIGHRVILAKENNIKHT